MDIARLSVKILSPLQTLYEGPAESVSAFNRVGPFDILPQHANFFSLLTEGDITVRSATKNFSFKALHGIMKVSQNQVTLFIYTP